MQSGWIIRTDSNLIRSESNPNGLYKLYSIGFETKSESTMNLFESDRIYPNHSYGTFLEERTQSNGHENSIPPLATSLINIYI